MTCLFRVHDQKLEHLHSHQHNFWIYHHVQITTLEYTQLLRFLLCVVFYVHYKAGAFMNTEYKAITCSMLCAM